MEGEDARGACSCRVSISQIKISSLTTALTTDLGKLTGKLSYRAGAMRRCRLPAWRRASWLGSPSQIRKPLRVLDCVWNVMCTQAENRFRLSAKRKSLFKSAGGRQFSRLLAAEVWASALVMLDTPCSVKGTGYPLHPPVSPSLPLPCVTVCHHVSTGLYLRDPCLLLLCASLSVWTSGRFSTINPNLLYSNILLITVPRFITSVCSFQINQYLPLLTSTVLFISTLSGYVTFLHLVLSKNSMFQLRHNKQHPVCYADQKMHNIYRVFQEE